DAWAEYASWGNKSKGGGTKGNSGYGKGGVGAAKGAGKGSGGKGAENLAVWKCEHCQYGKSLLPDWFCKHCKSPRPDDEDPRVGRLGAWANGPPALQPGLQPIQTGETLSESELGNMVSCTKRFGDVAAATQYQIALERLRAASRQPEEKHIQQRATAAHQRVQFLKKKKLNAAVEQLEKWRTWCDERATSVSQLSAQLEAADQEHKQLVDQLHSQVRHKQHDAPPTRAASTGLRPRDFIEGKVDAVEFMVAGDIFCIPEDECEIADGDMQILQQRADELKANIAEATKQ
ncbi:unnamed protein product, partial [Prorocentrum cordatum]